MKFTVYMLVVSVVYIAAMFYFCRELVKHPSKEERYENQSIPIIVGATALFGALTYQGVNFFL